MKRIFMLLIMIGSVVCFNKFADAATPIQVVQKELQHISNKQPVLYSKLWNRSMQNDFISS